MKRASPEVVAVFAILQRQYPAVLTYLEEWRTEELTKLPFAAQNTAIAQGRCQVLHELVELVSGSPEMADTFNGRPSPRTPNRSVTYG